MKEIYVAVLNDKGNNRADLHIYCKDGSEFIYHYPEERKQGEAALGIMAAQYNAKNKDALAKRGLFLETTPDGFDEIEENIEFSLGGHWEDETSENSDEDTSIQDNSEENLEETNISETNFGVFQLDDDGTPFEFHTFDQKGLEWVYDLQNMDETTEEAVTNILMQLAHQNGIETDINNTDNIITELIDRNILYVCDKDEFKELQPYIVNENRKMNEAIADQSTHSQEPYRFEDYFGTDFDDSFLSEGQNNNGSNDDDQTERNFLTEEEQKAYEKFERKMAKAKEKYFKKISRVKAKEEEKKKLATMSKKERRQYKRAKKFTVVKNFAGKIPVTGRFINKNQPKAKKKGNILRRAARFILIIITAAVLSILGLFSKDISNLKKGLFTQNNLENQLNNLNNKSNTNNNKNNTKNKNNTRKYKDIKDALNHANINDSKKYAISGVSSFLRDYNTKIAKANSKETKKTKLAHTWDEVMAFHLGVNDIGQQKINNIFDGYHFDANKFLNAFKRGVQQDVQAYIVNKDEINKDCLLDNDKGRIFLTNYEKLRIKYKSLSDTSDITREAVANQFYAKVREDYLSKDAKMKPYKAAALPIIKAMNVLTKELHFENKLSADERQEINQKVYEDVGKRLKSYQNKLAAHLEANDLTTNDELSYKDLKELAVRELKEKNNYNVIGEKRDITNQRNYKRVVAQQSKPTVVESDSPSKNKDSDKKESPKYTVHVKKKNNQSSKVYVAKSDINDWKVVETNEGISFDSNDIIINESQSVVDHNTSSDNFDDINNYFHNIDVNFDDNKPIVNDNPIDNGTIDDSYQDENGKLDSTVKNPTTDSTGAVSGSTSLPDPNVAGSEQAASGNQSSNEVVADQIVEDMANHPTSSTDSIKVLYK